MQYTSPEIYKKKKILSTRLRKFGANFFTSLRYPVSLIKFRANKFIADVTEIRQAGNKKRKET